MNVVPRFSCFQKRGKTSLKAVVQTSLLASFFKGGHIYAEPDITFTRTLEVIFTMPNQKLKIKNFSYACSMKREDTKFKLSYFSEDFFLLFQSAKLSTCDGRANKKGNTAEYLIAQTFLIVAGTINQAFFLTACNESWLVFRIFPLCFMLASSSFFCVSTPAMNRK